MHFSQLINIASFSQKSLLCVGLDPDPNKIPILFRTSQEPFYDFCRAIVDSTSKFASSYKLQNAYFVATGREKELVKIIAYIKGHHPELPVILDSKRGDIADTAKKYAEEAFVRYEADAVTVNPYMGLDSIRPYLSHAHKGVFVLARTSNPGANDFQMQTLGNNKKLYELVIESCLKEFGDQNLGFVAGATSVEDIKKIRALAPKSILLIPGVGTQGGDLNQVLQYAQYDKGQGAIINVSRAISYASQGDDFAVKASAAAAEYVKLMRSYFNQ